MCGIAGFYGFKNDELIKKISKQLQHRGPNGEGFYIDKNVSLLNRRLAIIDVKGGDQPIFNEDKSLCIVFNGEIYNFQELRLDLEKNGHRFSTHSDTEVILHGFEQWGEKCFDKLNGMFAIAIYDIKNKQLILARDHFGIKPLYYSIFSDKLIFSSEIKPIFYSGLIDKKPNDQIIHRYLKYRIHDDNDQTFFEGIKKLLPGEMMIFTKGKTIIKKYCNLQEKLLEKNPLNNVEQVNQFKSLLFDSIKRRLVSEVPVGTCLSGGLDSSVIVSAVNLLLSEKIKEAESVGKIQNTFSAVFPGGNNNEEKYVDELINFQNQKSLQKHKISCHKIYPKPEKFFEDLEDFVRTQEEPTISTGPYAQYAVMQEAHKFITVLLDGQGADEMMAGYLPYYFVYLRQLFKEKKNITLIKEIFYSKDVLSKYFIDKFSYILKLKNSVDVNSLINKNFASLNETKFAVTNNNLKKRLVEDIFQNSLQSLLRYEDRNSMRFSIEGRVPFLDMRLLSFIFSLSDEAIIKNGWNKFILREATRDLLPKMINRRRNKIGFTTPEKQWFLKMKNRIYGIFMSESFASRKYFAQKAVIESFKDFISGKNDDTMIFWRVMNVELWLREFFDEKKDVVKKEKSMFEANDGKKIEINVNGKQYSRYPIKTAIFEKGDDYVKKIANEVNNCINNSLFPFKNGKESKWFIVISEKIIAISQGRSYFIWDIKVSFWATALSKYVRRTPFGIGLGSPWTMQLAINEVGLFRILLGAIAAIVTKPFGMRGIFYHIAGREVSQIDGPTEYSLYPSNVSAKLGPKDPQQAAKNIANQINDLKFNSNLKNNLLGVVVIDANDIGRNILGNSTNLDDKFIEQVMRDNPMGQAAEMTPIILVRQEK